MSARLLAGDTAQGQSWGGRETALGKDSWVELLEGECAESQKNTNSSTVQ